MSMMLPSIIKLRHDQRGILTLELVIVFPLLISLLISMVYINNFYKLKMNLQSLNNEIVREVSANWSVTELARNKGGGQVTAALQSKYGNVILRKTIPLSLLVRKYIDKPLRSKQIRGVINKLPNGNQGRLEIALTYRYKIIIPFVSKTIMIKTKASERIWTIR
jgi:hypothetical protein